MKPNEAIKAQRLQLGLTEEEVAQKIGMSEAEYADLEQHSYEIYEITSLRNVKRVCEVLNLDFLRLLSLKCSFCKDSERYHDDYKLPRNELIRFRRNEMKLTTDALGERIGFAGTAIEAMEKDPDYLEDGLGIESIIDLSTELQIPRQVLFNVKCHECGR